MPPAGFETAIPQTSICRPTPQIARSFGIGWITICVQLIRVLCDHIYIIHLITFLMNSKQTESYHLFSSRRVLINQHPN